MFSGASCGDFTVMGKGKERKGERERDRRVENREQESGKEGII